MFFLQAPNLDGAALLININTKIQALNQKINPKQTLQKAAYPREGTSSLHQKIKVKMVSKSQPTGEGV